MKQAPITTVDAVAAVLACEIEAGVFEQHVAPALEVARKVAAERRGFQCGHDSDCAIHNMPAFPAGPCDCSVRKAFEMRFKHLGLEPGRNRENELIYVRDLAQGAWLGFNAAIAAATPPAVYTQQAEPNINDPQYRIGYTNGWADFADAVKAASEITAAPARYVLVPINPTLDMSIAFAEAFYSKARAIDDDDISDWWAAILAAAQEGKSPC